MLVYWYDSVCNRNTVTQEHSPQYVLDEFIMKMICRDVILPGERAKTRHLTWDLSVLTWDLNAKTRDLTWDLSVLTWDLNAKTRDLTWDLSVLTEDLTWDLNAKTRDLLVTWMQRLETWLETWMQRLETYLWLAKQWLGPTSGKYNLRLLVKLTITSIRPWHLRLFVFNGRKESNTSLEWHE